MAADTIAVLACPELNGARLRELAWELGEQGTQIYVAPALLDIAGPRTTIRPIARPSLLHLDNPELNGGRQILKAVFHQTVAAAAVVLLAPISVATAVVICADDGHLVFFRQTRLGLNGQTFQVWKFRTMVVDAEKKKKQKQAELLAHLNEGNCVLFKIRRHPRITKAGAQLRRYSLDELLQLFSVLLCEMSLVGLRPALPVETAEHGLHMLHKLAVKSRITGLWQVSGRPVCLSRIRSASTFAMERIGLLLDLQGLWKTHRAVTDGSGAY